MIRHCSGIVCLCITQEKADELNLPLMVEHNTSTYGTAFTISIEAAEGVTTGVSAADRVKTIKAAIAENATCKSLHSPGHVFPLIARPGGIKEREGHTEGSVELMKLAGLQPYAVLCELTNEDGTMAKLPEIIEFSKQHNYPIMSIDDLKNYATAPNTTNFFPAISATSEMAFTKPFPSVFSPRVVPSFSMMTVFTAPIIRADSPSVSRYLEPEVHHVLSVWKWRWPELLTSQCLI